MQMAEVKSILQSILIFSSLVVATLLVAVVKPVSDPINNLVANLEKYIRKYYIFKIVKDFHFLL